VALIVAIAARRTISWSAGFFALRHDSSKRPQARLPDDQPKSAGTGRLAAWKSWWILAWSMGRLGSPTHLQIGRSKREADAARGRSAPLLKC